MRPAVFLYKTAAVHPVQDVAYNRPANLVVFAENSFRNLVGAKGATGQDLFFDLIIDPLPTSPQNPASQWLYNIQRQSVQVRSNRFQAGPGRSDYITAPIETVNQVGVLEQVQRPFYGGAADSEQVRYRSLVQDRSRLEQAAFDCGPEFGFNDLVVSLWFRSVGRAVIWSPPASLFVKSFNHCPDPRPA
jgi:hypothetical protein